MQYEAIISCGRLDTNGFPSLGHTVMLKQPTSCPTPHSFVFNHSHLCLDSRVSTVTLEIKIRGVESRRQVSGLNMLLWYFHSTSTVFRYATGWAGITARYCSPGLWYPPPFRGTLPEWAPLPSLVLCILNSSWPTSPPCTVLSLEFDISTVIR